MWELILTSLMLGVGLAMDACAVSMTNGLNEPKMRAGKAMGIGGMFAFFQALMPMIGWTCVSLVAERFAIFAEWVPYIALVLLVIIGVKMLYDGFKDMAKSKKQFTSCKAGAEELTEKTETGASKPLTFVALIIQAVATSIDALSTGFSLADIAGNAWWKALVCVGIIAVVTFGISVAGIYVGKKVGNKLGSRAEIVGGVILICIGIEIFVSGVFF